MVGGDGLAGYALAADKSFATVPLTCYVFRLGDHDDPRNRF
jgi:hypothetical protein